MNSAYLFGFLSSKNGKKTHANQNKLQAFRLCPQRNDTQTLDTQKVAPAKIFFSSLHVTSTTSFDKCFLFHV